MIEEGLKVKFTGDADQLATELQQLQSRLKRFEDAVKSATDPKSLATFQRAVDLTKQKIEALGRTQEKAPMQAFKANADSATQSLTNLSRVAQDAPYGFIGIANNINPLLESFQRLQVETGSTKNAFKTMLAGLTGPAGIGLAVGVVSSLLVTFGDKLFSSGSAADAFDTKMAILNATLKTTSDRIEDIVDNLNFQKQLDTLDVKIQGLGQVTDFRYQLQGIEAAIAEIRPGLDDLSKRKINLQVDLETAAGRGLSKKEIEQLQKEFDATNSAFEKSQKEFVGLDRTYQLIVKQIDLQKIEDQKDTDRKAEEQREKDLAAHKKYLEQLKKLAEAQAELVRIMSQIKLDAITPKITSADFPDTSFDDFTEAYITAINSHLNEGVEGITITPEMQLAFDKMKIDDKAKKDVQDQINKTVNDLVTSAKGGLAVGIGEGIGDILSGKGFDSVFKNIANVMGDFISQLGKMLIKAAIAAAAFKKAFAALLANPVAAIGVGIGLVAVGQFLKNVALPKARAFAAGGLVFGPTFGLVGEGAGTNRSNPEIVAPLNDLGRYLGGGQQTQVFIPALEASYDKWRVVFNKANKHGRALR